MAMRWTHYAEYLLLALKRRSGTPPPQPETRKPFLASTYTCARTCTVMNAIPAKRTGRLLAKAWSDGHTKVATEMTSRETCNRPPGHMHQAHVGRKMEKQILPNVGPT